MIIIVFETTILSLKCLVRFNSHEIKFMFTLQAGGPDETNISHGSICVLIKTILCFWNGNNHGIKAAHYKAVEFFIKNQMSLAV